MLTLNEISVDKNLISCYVCKSLPIKALQSACCDTVICYNCSIKALACPVCNDHDAIFNENELINKIISSRMVKCEECNEYFSYKDIPSHQIKEHNLDLYEMNKYGVSHLYLKEKSVFDIHRHFLVLATSGKDMVCSSDKYVKSKNEFCIGKINANLKFYACETCKICFCLNCFEFKQFKHYIQEHSCPLIKTYKERGWTCNGRDLKDKCKSGDSKFVMEDLKMRFRCSKCDFDLCGQCMNHYEI